MTAAGKIIRSVYDSTTGWIHSSWIGGVQAAYVVRSLNVRAALRKVPPGPGDRVLDAGCGEGAALASVLARRYPAASFTAVDLFAVPSAAMPSNLTALAGDVERPLPEGGFQAAYCLDLLEHVQDPAAVLRNLFAALVPGGRLLVHVPAAWPFSFFKAAGDGFLPAFRETRRGDAHLREGFSEEELAGFLSRAGFSDIKMRRTFSKPTWFFKELYTLGERRGIPGIGLLLLPFMLLFGSWDRVFPPARGNGLWAEALKPA